MMPTGWYKERTYTELLTVKEARKILSFWERHGDLSNVPRHYRGYVEAVKQVAAQKTKWEKFKAFVSRSRQ